MTVFIRQRLGPVKSEGVKHAVRYFASFLHPCGSLVGHLVHVRVRCHLLEVSFMEIQSPHRWINCH